MSDKKLANMHYPGMRADPDEGKHPLHPQAAARFQTQIECIGEAAQRALLHTSVLILDSSPMAVLFAQKLAAYGIGRLGLFGEQPLTAAHALTDEKAKGAIDAFSTWVKTQAPWIEFESFRTASLDRQLDDIVRGFDVVVSTNAAQAQSAYEVVRDHQASFIAFGAAGQHGWRVCLPATGLKNFNKNFPPVAQDGGVFVPMIDRLTTSAALWVVDFTLAPERTPLVVETVDASSVPWVCKTQ